jgi:hypothetical protein
MNKILQKREICFLIFCVVQVFVLTLSAQEAPIPFNIEFHGFVNHEIIYDSRQVVTAREGEVLVFPAEEILDPDGNDINARANLNFFALSTRLQTKITGPDAFGAKTSALVEVDFLGTTNDKFNLLRMRHAFLQLNWTKTELVAGQTWHPMFVAACFPMVVNFGGSLPYHVLSRAPMLKLTYKPGKLAMTAFLLTQSDFPTSGPQGASSVYIRNSGLPEIYGQLMYSSRSLLLGATAGYMVLHPELKTATGYRNDASISALTANVFGKLSTTSFTLRTQGIYSDNANHLVMLGGFGETEVTDALTDERGYSNVGTMSVWADVESNGPKFKVGFFAGYSENLGSKKEITGRSWVRGGNISNIYRLGPRLIIISGKLAWGMEVFYDVAVYGTPDSKFQFDETRDVANIRLLSSLKYSF